MGFKSKGLFYKDLIKSILQYKNQANIILLYFLHLTVNILNNEHGQL